MLFVVIGHFRKGSEQKEIGLREQFTDHLESKVPRLRLGGPLMDADGVQAATFYVAEAASRSSIGLYDRIEINQLHLEVGSMN